MCFQCNSFIRPSLPTQHFADQAHACAFHFKAEITELFQPLHDIYRLENGIARSGWGRSNLTRLPLNARLRLVTRSNTHYHYTKGI